jgi:hypothetical protein
MTGRNKNPLLGWHAPAELSDWARAEAKRRGVKLSQVLNEALEHEMEREPVTEHAVEMSGGGMHVRWDDPEMERIYPLAQWIPAQQRHGGHVWRRRIIVVEDWSEVPSETAATKEGSQ